VAEASLSWLKWTGRTLAAFLAALVLMAVSFLLLGWIGSAIPRNGPTPQVQDGIQIMVETNGTHTGIVMPIVTEEFDWSEHFPSARQPSNGRLPTHIAVGWGESEIFLHTPTWGDLKPSTALRIAVTGGEPVMRVSNHFSPAPGEFHRPVTIGSMAYRRMAQAIEESLLQEAGEREILHGTIADDAYYRARGHYTLINTCNSWVGDMLAKADIQIGLWTPFAGGVMKWIEVPETS
jgi:uncharacterized protein (TIGR02117 family)